MCEMIKMSTCIMKYAYRPSGDILTAALDCWYTKTEQ